MCNVLLRIKFQIFCIFFFSDTDPSEIYQYQFNVLPGNFVDVADEDELEDDYFDAIGESIFFFKILPLDGITLLSYVFLTPIAHMY